MATLIPFKPSMLKQMGIVNTKKGPMVDASKLTDKKKFVKPVEIKEVRKPIKIEVKKKFSPEEKENREKRGVY